jgi:hypothetical protein
LNWDVVFEFKDYKHFDTGSEQEKLIVPANKKPMN